MSGFHGQEWMKRNTGCRLSDPKVDGPLHLPSCATVQVLGDGGDCTCGARPTWRTCPVCKGHGDQPDPASTEREYLEGLRYVPCASCGGSGVVTGQQWNQLVADGLATLVERHEQDQPQ